METKPPTITDTELALIRAFAQGYINALVNTTMYGKALTSSTLTMTSGM
jgi:hypothetical protein